MTCTDLFIAVYQSLNATNLAQLDDLYHEHVTFEDPFHTLNGLPAFRDYCAVLYANVTSCEFTFSTPVIAGDQAYLSWEMALAHPRLNGGKLYRVPGCSHIRFDDKVYYHRDYFDGGTMLYERLPMMGAVVRWVKGRMGQ